MCVCVSSPGQHGIASVVVKQAKAMTRPEGDQIPLGVQRYRSDGGWRQALDKHQWLESWGEGGGFKARLQPVVTLPREALPVLQQVNHRHVHQVVRTLVTQTQNNHLERRERGAGITGELCSV